MKQCAKAAGADYERIAREIVEEAIATDQSEDELYAASRTPSEPGR